MLTPMDAFVKDLLGTTRTVLFGRTADAVKRLLEIPLERLLLFEAAIAFLIAIQAAVASGNFLLAIGIPVSLLAATILWSYLFAVAAELERKQMPEIHALFLSSSTVLLPGVVPIIGPFLLQALFLAWPFLLGRLLANLLNDLPGRVFLQLVLPPVGLWMIAQFILFIAGKALFTT
jgi:hypothetical protein